MTSRYRPGSSMLKWGHILFLEWLWMHGQAKGSILPERDVILGCGSRGSSTTAGCSDSATTTQLCWSRQTLYSIRSVLFHLSFLSNINKSHRTELISTKNNHGNSTIDEGMYMRLCVKRRITVVKEIVRKKQLLFLYWISLSQIGLYSCEFVVERFRSCWTWRDCSKLTPYIISL